jgi:hypothetical protein
MAEISFGSNLGTPLQNLLMCDSIEPGSDASYQTCKEIWIFHVLGDKIAGWPIQMAQSQAREISVANSPGDHCKDAFLAAWHQIGADEIIRNAHTLARVYGASAIICGQDPKKTAKPLDISKLAEGDIYFNVFDPLNVAGSLVLDLNPNSPDFLKKLGSLTASGTVYHASRCCVVFNGKPIYLAYTSSAYGYVGRSAYQSILFPLKSFVQSMYTDDMVTTKAGLLVVAMQQAGSIISGIMGAASAVKRAMLRIGKTGNVLTIGEKDRVETLNMQNTDNAMTTARKNILDNIATGAPMPAKVLNSETFAEGFGEGTEDAKDIARWIDGIRKDMNPTYAYMDRIAQYRAWDKEFFDRMKNLYPDVYGKMSYEQAFTSWQNSFVAEWPNLLKPSVAEEADAEKVRLEAIIALLEVLIPAVDPTSKTMLIQAALDNFNALKLLFPTQFEIDADALEEFLTEQNDRMAQMGAGDDEGAKEPSPPKPFRADSAGRRLAAKWHPEEIAAE